MATPLLNVEDLTVTYSMSSPPLAPALRNVDFCLHTGEFVVVLGESGAGKTTLARAIVQLLPVNGRVTGGRVTFCGVILTGLAERRMAPLRGAGIAMMLQEPGLALNPLMTAIGQVTEVIRAHSRAGRKVALSSAKRALEEVGLLDAYGVQHAYPHQMSGGQRQRLLLAMSLAAKPRLLLADEPTSAVDAELRIQLKGLLKRLRETSDLAMLWNTHDTHSMTDLADRILVLYAGELVEDAPAADLMTRPLHPYTRLLLASAPPNCRPSGSYNKRLPEFPGSIAQVGCSFAPRCPDRIASCSDQKPALVQLANRTRVRCVHYVQ